MTITSELIGKLGGSDVEVIPVEASATEKSGSQVILHTVEVPEGETCLVAVYGDLRSHYNGSSASVQLYIGTTVLGGQAGSGMTGMMHVGTGTIEVKMRRNGNSGTDSFTGHVYVVQL